MIAHLHCSKADVELIRLAGGRASRILAGAIVLAFFVHLIPGTAMAAAPQKAEAGTRILEDFETQGKPGVFAPVQGLAATPSRAHVTHGNSALLLVFPKGAEFPGLKWETDRPTEVQDWSGHEHLRADMFNESSANVMITLKLKSADGGQYSHRIPLVAGEARTVELPLARAKAEGVDLSRISYVNLFMYRPGADVRVFLDYLRLETASGRSVASAAAAPTRTRAESGNDAATLPGAVTLPHPTLSNLSIEWAIDGDANLNGIVAVRYRQAGTTAWKHGMPLRRVPAGMNQGFRWKNRHSGSVFDLHPATAYEIELTLTDPDGGSTTRTVSARTRDVPGPMAGAPVKAVTPSTFAGVAASARPGDILELAAGTYSWPDWSTSGTAARPIVIRSNAGAIINGEVGLLQRHHIQLSGLTVNGRIRFNGSNNVAITRCRINATRALAGDGIVSFRRSENAYIADNTVTGGTEWAESSFGNKGKNLGEGIAVTGPGHVIINNRVSGFRDGISLLEDDEAVDQFSIDILNNDISEAADDGIEADFCMHNCRILRNRITNSFIAMSSQPGLGGPTYFIRNVAYNVAHLAFKLYRGSVGDVLLHNTVVKNGDAFGVYAGAPVARTFSRNNVWLGGPGASYNGFSSGSGRVIAFPDLVAPGASMDYDAMGSASGAFGGRLGGTSFSSLAELRQGTTEKNAIQADLGMFATSVAFPATATHRFAAQDLRPGAGSALVGSAQQIPNINDAADKPTRGAYEPGLALPVYGPRP